MIYPAASALWTRAFSPQVCGSVPESRRRMRRPFLLGVLLAALVFLPSLVAPAPAAAHPLGNFTVNRYSRLELSPDRLRIRYVLDAAEIPTFQAMPTLDANGDGRLTDAEKQAHAVRQLAGIIANLRLTLDGKAILLRVTSQELELLPGQAGLQTTRLSGWLDAPEAAAALRQAASSGSAIALEYRDGNEPAKIGWREIVVRAEGVAISPTAGGAPVPTKDVADELRTYPEDMLAGPLDVRDLRLAINPPAMTGAGATGATGGAADARRPAAQSLSRKGDGFAEMFAGAASGTLTPGVIALALLSAVVLGGMHSMSPGHGKTIVGAYLVGSRGTAKHALFLGLTVTTVHTIGVFALGLATLLASQYVVPERVYPWMSLVSGLLVLGMGFSLFRARLRASGLPAPLARLLGHQPQPAGWAVSGAHCAACAANERLLTAGLLGTDSPTAHGALVHTHDGAHVHDAGGSGAQRVAEHSHGFGSHTHAVPGADGQPVTWKRLLALGISGGLLPCPSALVVMLGAIALHQVAFGLVLIVFFSIGLAGTLMAVGLLMVYSGRLAGRVRLPDRLGRGRLGSLVSVTRYMPIVSAGVVGLAGLALTVDAVRQMDLLDALTSAGPAGALEVNLVFLCAGGLAVYLALRWNRVQRGPHLVRPIAALSPGYVGEHAGTAAGHDHPSSGWHVHGDSEHVHDTAAQPIASDAMRTPVAAQR